MNKKPLTKSSIFNLLKKIQQFPSKSYLKYFIEIKLPKA